MAYNVFGGTLSLNQSIIIKNISIKLFLFYLHVL